MTDIEKLCKRLEAEASGPFVEPSDRALYAQAATALRSVHARAVKAEEERDEAFIFVPPWPKWAAKIRATLRSFGAETDDEDGCDLPEAFATWVCGFGAAAQSRALTAEAALADAQAAVKVLREAGEEIADAADEFESASRDHRSLVTNNRVLSAIDAARAALSQTASYGEGE